MSTLTPFNLTIVLPPNRQYYVSYFYPYEYNGGYTNNCKYRSNVTTALEEGWHTADIYNEFWKDNPTRGEPIVGNIYKVPFTFEYDVILNRLACTYFVFSWYEDNELKYFVYAMNRENALGGNTSYGHGELVAPDIVTDEDGSLLVYIGFLTNYASEVYAPGRKIYNHVLGVDEALIQASQTDKCIYEGTSFRDTYYNNFPYEVLVNGYHIYRCPDGIIYGNYNLRDGYNEGYKIPELVGAIVKEQFGLLNWNPFTDDKGTSKDYVVIYRFKFTRTGDSDPNRTIFRVIKLSSAGAPGEGISIWGDLWIDAETKELKIQSHVFTPYLRVLKQLPDNALYSWHELALTFDSSTYVKGIYFDGEYIDIVEIAGRSAYSQFTSQKVESYPKCMSSYLQSPNEIATFNLIMSQDKSMLVDYIGVHRNTELEPYVMMDNYFDYYDPILPDIPEPEPEPDPEEPTIINKNIYLVCYKGATSIFDKLIRIIKTNLTSKEFPPPPIDPRLRHLVGRLPPPLKGTFIPPLAQPEHILNALPKNYPTHVSPRPIEVLLSKILNSDYTHVGLWIVPENTPIPKEITYYACREDAGVMEYTEAYTDVDLYKINMPTVKPCHVKKFFEKTQYKHGSMIGDMGYRHLMHEHSMSSVEWVAAALNLAFPCKYTINKLIDFANLEE